MVKLTPLKIRRMSLGLRQIDLVLGTGIQASRLSLIENELVEPTERELELISGVLLSVRKNRSRERVEESVPP